MFLPGSGPLAVGAAFYLHAASRCVVVDPSSQRRDSRDRSGLGLFLPTSSEGELNIAVTLGSGDCEIFPECSAPCAGNRLSVAAQIH